MASEIVYPETFPGLFNIVSPKESEDNILLCELFACTVVGYELKMVWG